jgi:hypothetical protein
MTVRFGQKCRRGKKTVRFSQKSKRRKNTVRIAQKRRRMTVRFGQKSIRGKKTVRFGQKGKREDGARAEFGLTNEPGIATNIQGGGHRRASRTKGGSNPNKREGGPGGATRKRRFKRGGNIRVNPEPADGPCPTCTRIPGLTKPEVNTGGHPYGPKAALRRSPRASSVSGHWTSKSIISTVIASGASRKAMVKSGVKARPRSA